MKLEYSVDVCGNEILQDDSKMHQIMMEWEKPYMEESIEKLNPSGKVLDVGFGMGYSATKMCSMTAVTEYNVVECSPVVWRKFETWKKEQLEKRPELIINLIPGRWQDVLDKETHGVFDFIYFDDYNGDDSVVDSMTRFPKFIYRILTDHVKIGSKICSYSTTDRDVIPNVTCVTFECHNYDITVPEHCNYARGTKMYIPIWTVITDVDVDVDLKDKKIKITPGNNINYNIDYPPKIKKLKDYYDNSRGIYCNIMIIDNFYTNALETRDYILKQEFKVRGNYPGQRTISYATEGIKTIIENHIQHFAGKITEWPMYTNETQDTYNGTYQYTTSRDRSWIHTDGDGVNNWTGVLYMTPNAPIGSGTGIYRFKDGTRFNEEADVRGSRAIIDEYSQDYTKWEMVDKIGNVFNRLVLLNSKQFHGSLDYFGTNKENGRLFQVFFFSTEK